MTNTTPKPGNDTGMPARGPITEDDLDAVHALALSIDLCSSTIPGLCDPETARNALPGLIELQMAEIARLYSQASESEKGAAA